MARKFVTLTYHRVRPEPDPLIPDMCHAERFRSQLAVMSTYFNVIPLAQAIDGLANGTLPSRAVCITFDDGYRDNHDVALPLLKEAGCHATFFVTTGFLNDGMMFNDKLIHAVRHRREGEWDLTELGLGTQQVGALSTRTNLVNDVIAALKHRPQAEREAITQRLFDGSDGPRERVMMTDEELHTLGAAGMHIGAHTVTHPILTRLDDASARAELADGRADLAARSGADVRLFAYPNGRADADYAIDHVRMARDVGFEAALTTMWGYTDAGSPRFELPRVGLEWESGWRFGVKLWRCFFEAQAGQAKAERLSA
ncbi:MAG: polysaccharide deacetylase family protein [Pseudomonadota bacterium]